MMKKILLTLLAFMATIAMNAEQVSKQQALQKAQQFMPNKHFGEVKAFARGEKLTNPEEYEAFYIFNAEGKKGFVIVSGDDRTEPILGYSDRGSLNIDSVPDNVKGLLNYYEKVLTAIANDKSYTRPAKTRGGERAKVETLMATEWGQDFPYNLKCPVVNGKHVVTGCVATALAQVLNYNRWPKDNTSAVPAYTTGSKQIDMPQLEPIKFGWGTMDMNFLSNLMLYCGQAVQMNYGVDESSADVSQIPNVLKTIFGYTGDPKYVEKENYSDEEWDNMMYAEMSGGRPVLYSGFGELSTGYSGHAFVIDGYDSGRYHVNWGWDGDSNGLFMLTGLNVTGGTFNDHQSAVIGVQSPEGPTGAVVPLIQVNDIVHNNKQKFFWRQDDGKFPSIEITAYEYGTSSEKKSLQIGWGIFNKNGLVKVYAQEQQEIGSDFSEGYWHISSISIGEDIADGNYSILPVCRSNDSEEWTADAANIYGRGLLPNYYTELYISKDLMKLVFGGTSTVFERENHGYLIKEGIAYDLWQDLDRNCFATVIPPQSGHYSGDVIIPDVVSHNSKEYRVYDAELSAFENCPELTSLSTSMNQMPRIVDCPQLATIKFREGVRESNSLSLISECNSLKSISFNTTDQLLFHKNPFGDNLPVLTDVYFMSMYPPCSPPLFGGERYDFPVKENVTVHIPKGTISTYSNSMWKDWKLIEDQIVDNNGIKWGYYIDNNIEHYNSPEIGSFARCDVDLAIRVPAEMLEKYKDKKITGIEFFCINMLKSNFPDYVFITKPGTDYLVKQPAEVSQTTGWKSVLLSEPYTITGDELYVGIGRNSMYDYTISMNEPKQTDAIWSRIMDDDKEWENESSSATGYPLTLRFIIEGEDLPKDLRLCQARLDDENTPSKVLLSVVNRCSDLLTSYTVKWDFDGKVKGTKTVETCLASSLAETISIDIPSELEGYHHTFTLDVVSVNGEEDAIPANSHLVYEFTHSPNHFPHKMVLEEFVATWCGWSPRGYSAVEKMNEKYPDRFFPIEIHENSCSTFDAVGEPENYKTYIEKYASTPTFLINRVKTIESTLDNAISAMEDMNDADAMISANAVFATEDKTSVTIKTAATFGFTDDGNADFRIAYVIVEDNVGPYSQANFYSDSSMPDNPDDYMNDWYKKGSPIEMKFDNVARGIYPDLNGKEGSVPTSVVAGLPYEYEYTFELPDNIQDKKNIRLVTLLIDNKSGKIMNADQTKVITETDMKGDADNDNVVDNKDVDAVIRYIMYGDINGFNFKNADVNKDDKVDVTDIVLIVNMIK